MGLVDTGAKTMMAFISLYMGWIKTGLVLALLVALGVGYHTWAGHEQAVGAAKVQLAWNKDTIQRNEQAVKLEAAHRKIELAWNQKVIEANNEATKREESLRKSAVAAKSESVSLRNQLAAIKRQLPSLAADAVRNYASTATDVLDQCQQEYQGLAEEADRLASTILTLQQAWPK